MKAFWVIAAAGIGLTGLLGPAAAQPRGGYGYGGPDYGYEDRNEGYRERAPRYRERGYAFDEREYLRCNPDVRRGVWRGEVQSGFAHFQQFGRAENRRLRC
jgi:hypothetical protein